MRKCLVLGLVVLLSGCALGSMEALQKEGDLQTIESKKSMAEATECLMRNADTIGAPARILPNTPAGTTELAFPYHSFFARITAKPPGSLLQVWSEPLLRYNVWGWPKKLTDGC